MSRQAIKLLFKRHRAAGATTPTMTGTEGYRDDDGTWHPPTTSEEDTPIVCVLLPLKASFVLSSAGVYTSRDRELYSYSPLAEKQKVKHNGITYSVEQESDYSTFSGVYVYVVKAVDGFAEGQ